MYGRFDSIALARLCACGVACAGLSVQAQAGTEPATEAAFQAADEALPIRVVTGNRASLSASQRIKQEKTEIVDSVAAEDIGKLPDVSVTDALSRVTGVQILRDRGEGAGVAIRGLTQIETTLNGRELFTAGAGRTLDFADIPSEMLSGIDVYKTTSASRIEGGVGGSIDLRTHRPFDFSGRKVVASLRVNRGDLGKREQAQFSTLLSDRWNTGAGEFGALLDLVYQQRSWREDQKGIGGFVARTDLLPGRTVLAPSGISDSVSIGRRDRKSAGLVLEWAPSDSLKLYSEANYVEFLTLQDTYQLNLTAPATFQPGSPTLFPGTNHLQGITWTNAAATAVGAARDTLDRTSQVAAGAVWSGTSLTVKGDLSHTRSHNQLYYSALTLGGTANSLLQSQAGGVSTYALGAGNLASLANFNSAGMWYAARPFDGDLTAATLDGEYQVFNGWLETLSAGVRWARRNASDAPGQVVDFPAAPAVGNAAGLTVNNPYGGFLTPDPAAARDVMAARAVLGINAPLPTSNPLGTWTVSEDTQSGYLMANLKRAAWDGNLGVRMVNTRERVDGNMGPSAGPYSPVHLGNDATDVLPSTNLRYALGDGLYLRGAASKTLTRQDFNLLSPSLTLNPIQLNGTAGNPALRPVRADNLDVALERYADHASVAYLTGFWKRVDGFVTTLINPEVYGGQTYQVSRPYNLGTAFVEGVELGYQHFFLDVPDWLRGTGLQANYTYVDSRSVNPLTGQQTGLQNLSANSYNLIGLYELGPVSARLAYNWRDRFISGFSNVAGTTLPVYMRGYGWLDASFTYRLSAALSLTLEGSNLLRTVRSSYFGTETLPQNTWMNDRQLSVLANLKF